MNLSYEVLALMFPGRENILTVGQHGWREVYEYNNNGNRITKVTPWGKIEYAYDAENRLVSKGRITYQYDQDGNLLTETGPNRTAEYEYLVCVCE